MTDIFSSISNVFKSIKSGICSFFGIEETPTPPQQAPLANGWNVGIPSEQVPYIGFDTFNGTLNTIIPAPDGTVPTYSDPSQIPFPPNVTEDTPLRTIPMPPINQGADEAPVYDQYEVPILPNVTKDTPLRTIQMPTPVYDNAGNQILPNVTKDSPLRTISMPVVSEIPHNNKVQDAQSPDMKYDNRTCKKLKLNLDRNLYGPKFLNRVKDIANKVNCDYKDLIAVMFSESGLKTDVKHKKGTATGLIQFLEDSAKSVGTTVDALAEMTPMQQLDYVEKLLLKTKRFCFSADKKLNPTELYSIIFLPAFADREVLTVKGEKYYKWNTGADKDGDGKITKDDLWTRLQDCYVDDTSFA